MYDAAAGRGQIQTFPATCPCPGAKWIDPQSEAYRKARGDRSAVESLMFTIKDGFEFGELGRRGLSAVREELLEKVLAYNCCRIILMRKRHREKLDLAS